MAQITVSEGQFRNYQAEAGVKLRIYCRRTFTASDDAVIVRGTVDADDFYLEVDCTVNGTVITHDAFVIDSTEDGSPDSSYYTFGLYDSGGTRIALPSNMGKLRIPSSPTTTTMGAILTHNEASCECLDGTYYTASQIDAILEGYNDLALKETTVLHGVGRLSHAAVDVGDPINVGDNDPVIRVLRQRRYLEEWNGDLEQAIADIGITDTILVVSQPQQYTKSGSAQSVGPLVVGDHYQILDYSGVLHYIEFLEEGTGYSTGTNVQLTGGSGSTGTIDITFVSGGAITGYSINNVGSDYQVGDRLTVVGGNGDAIVEVKSVVGDEFQNTGWVPMYNDAGYNYFLFNREGTVWQATNTTPTTWTNGTTLRHYLTVPTNITIEFEGPGTLACDQYGGIFINSMIDPGQRQVFTLSDFGSVIVHPRAVEELNLAWWSGRGTGTDDTREIKCVRDSLSYNRNGGMAYIPGGVWYTDPIIWTPGSNIRGAGYNLNPDNGDNTCVQPADETDTYSYVFSIAQRSYGISFSDLSLYAGDTGEGISPFRVVLDMPGIYQVDFHRVFFKGAPVPGAVRSCIIDGSRQWHEVINFSFFKPIFDCDADTSCFYWRSSNSGFHMDNPTMRVGARSTAWEVPVVGWAKITNADPRGVAVYEPIETTQRTITAAGDTTSGVDILTLNEDYTGTNFFTDEDIGRYITCSTAFPAPAGASDPYYYIYKLNSPWEAVIRGGPNYLAAGDGEAEATVSNQNVVIIDSVLDETQLAKCVFDIGYSIGFQVDGGADEGFFETLVYTTADATSQVTLKDYFSQGYIRTESGLGRLLLLNCQMWSKNIIQNGATNIQIIDGSVKKYVAGSNGDRFPWPGQPIARGQHFKERGNASYPSIDTSKKEYDTGEEHYEAKLRNWLSPSMIVTDPNAAGSPEGDELPVVSILSPSTVQSPDIKTLLRVGHAHWGNPDIPRFYYDFKWCPDVTRAGYLLIEGNQGSPYCGIYHNGTIYAQDGFTTDGTTTGGTLSYDSGGNTTQATNKTTTVTQNRRGGFITTATTGTISAHSSVRFLVNSTAVHEWDVIVCNVENNTGSGIIAVAEDVATGSFYIKLVNYTASDQVDTVFTISWSCAIRPSYF